MATRKRGAAKPKAKAVTKAKGSTKGAKRPAKAAPAKRASRGAAAKAKPAAKAPAPKLKARQQPESLRLRAAMPSLTVNDLAKSLAFYRDGLGFFVTDTWKKDGEVLGYMLKAGSCELGIGQDDWAKGRDRLKGLGLRIYYETTQDVDAIAAQVREAGYELYEPVTNHSWGARGFALVDPDGFKVSIYRLTAKK